MELVGLLVDLPELERAIEEHGPAVVITDIRMPPTGTDEGLRAAERLRAEGPDVRVVVLSQYAEPEYALALLEKGANGRAYLLKERVSDIDQLVGAVREVARGGSVIDPRVVEVLVAARTAVRNSPIAQLTPRERDVLQQVAMGKNNAGIAASCFSPSTPSRSTSTRSSRSSSSRRSRTCIAASRRHSCTSPRSDRSVALIGVSGADQDRHIAHRVSVLAHELMGEPDLVEREGA